MNEEWHGIAPTIQFVCLDETKEIPRVNIFVRWLRRVKRWLKCQNKK